MLKPRRCGSCVYRNALRALSALKYQLPPRITLRRPPQRPTGSAYGCGGRSQASSSHHSHTLPCMSYKPHAFARSEPAATVRARYRPALRGERRTECVRSVCAGAARILPLRLGRQTERALMQSVQAADERLGVEPRDLLDRRRRISKGARIAMHQRSPLPLRHFGDRHEERMGQSHAMKLFVRTMTGLRRRRSHLEFARRDEHECHARVRLAVRGWRSGRRQEQEQRERSADESSLPHPPYPGRSLPVNRLWALRPPFN